MPDITMILFVVIIAGILFAAIFFVKHVSHLASQMSSMHLASQKLGEDLIRLQQATSDMRTGHEQRLQGMSNQITLDLGGVATNLNQMKEKVTEVNRVVDSIKSLEKIMNNSKVRGNAGESLLENLLSDFLVAEQYSKNYKMADSNEVVEFAIKVPSGDRSIWLPIDSKAPADRIREYLEAKDSGNRDLILSTKGKLETKLKDDAKEIYAKYVNKSTTTQIGILYLPFESWHNLVVNDLSEKVAEIRKDFHVLIAGPTNLASLLAIIQIGYKNYNNAQNADAIHEILTSFNKQVRDLFDQIDKTKNNMTAGMKHLVDLETRVRAVSKSLQRLSGKEDEPEQL